MTQAERMYGGDILITGMGVVTPIGASVEQFWKANLAGKSGLVREYRMDLSPLPCGWVAGIIPESFKVRVAVRSGRPGRSWGDILMHDVVDQALDDADLTGPLDAPAALMYSRVWPGPSGSFPQDYDAQFESVARRYEVVGTDPAATVEYLRDREIPAELTDVSGFQVEIAEKLGVPVKPAKIEATCSGGLRAIAEAARMMRLGEAEVAVVAASVSRSTPYVLSQYGQLMALSRWKGDPAQASMPFDARRSGMVINESAGAVILETAEHARRRGAPHAYAAVGGWGIAVGTGHVTAPEVPEVERVIRNAIESSGMTPEDIDTINAHGTSTKLNDATEAAALRRVFGDRLAEIDVCAVKSLTGHGSAASGVVETVVAALTLTHNVVPPVVTCTEPDPKCGVKTSLTPVERPVGTVLKCSFGFGGQYASMVFRKAERVAVA
jgi:3-oxoacyl-[acyl-carrier-protein] synthase II